MKYMYVASFRISGGLIHPTWRVTEWEDDASAMRWVMGMFDSQDNDEGQVNKTPCGAVTMFNSGSSDSLALIVAIPEVLP